MKAYIGDGSWMNGPIILSSYPLARWKTERTGKLQPFLKKYHIEKAVFENPVPFDAGGDALLLPTGRETVWHARPWGGYLVRMVELENTIAQDAAAKWKPDGVDASAWKETSITLRAKKPLALVDIGLAHKDLPAGSIPVKLAPGAYHVDVADNVTAEKGRIFQVIRLRLQGAVMPTPQVKTPKALDAIVTKEHQKLARSLSLAESEGGPMLLVSGDLLPSWRGDETGDYDRACAAKDGKGVRIAAGTGIVLGSPDPTGFVRQGDAILVYRQLGAGNTAGDLAMALSLPAKKWKKTAVTLRVGKSKTLYLLDSVLDGKVMSAKKRLGGSATRIELPSGTYRYETAGEFRTPKSLFELHRLVRQK